MRSHAMPSSFKLFCCLLFLSYMEITISLGKENCSSSCGNLQNIKPPFRLRDDPIECGNRHFELDCEDNQTVLEIRQNKYDVKNISYDNYEITLLDVGLARSSCNLPDGSISYTDDIQPFHFHFSVQATFFNCTVKIDDSTYEFVPCLSKNNSIIYVKIDYDSEKIEFLPVNCHFLSTTAVKSDLQISTFDGLKLGFPLYWSLYNIPVAEVASAAEAIINCATIEAHETYYYSYYYDDEKTLYYLESLYYFELSFLTCLQEIEHRHSRLTISAAAAIFLLLDITLLILVFQLIGRYLFAPLCLLSFLLYNLFKLMVPIDIVERFLQNQKALSPTRFSYNEIITITNNFKEKIGQGGFGSVFKGRLPGGYLVAVKMLGKSMGDGDDFINEVSTIGRIHHVNVVQLVGFCAEGSYRALVYEYMANGSLDKYIFSSNRVNRLLTKEKFIEIALSVAKGLHYLHQGCNMRILHFDIKPHNILLDHKFTPKISDFGLAKLHPRDHSLVSISAARGTIGYIAPELVSRSFGPISHKSDVYSFGMLLMDMAGHRRHTKMMAENSNQIYYPSWIYDQLQKREVSGNNDIIEIDDLERKLCLVGLCCIQTRPLDRPSMVNVVEMLEADVDSLLMPPKPFFSSSDPMPPTNYSMDSSLSKLSIISENL